MVRRADSWWNASAWSNPTPWENGCKLAWNEWCHDDDWNRWHGGWREQQDWTEVTSQAWTASSPAPAAQDQSATETIVDMAPSVTLSDVASTPGDAAPSTAVALDEHQDRDQEADEAEPESDSQLQLMTSGAELQADAEPSSETSTLSILSNGSMGTVNRWRNKQRADEPSSMTNGVFVVRADAAMETLARMAASMSGGGTASGLQVPFDFVTTAPAVEAPVQIVGPARTTPTLPPSSKATLALPPSSKAPPAQFKSPPPAATPVPLKAPPTPPPAQTRPSVPPISVPAPLPELAARAVQQHYAIVPVSPERLWSSTTAPVGAPAEEDEECPEVEAGWLRYLGPRNDVMPPGPSGYVIWVPWLRESERGF